MFDVVVPVGLVIFLILVVLAQRRNNTAESGAPFVPLEPDVIERILKLADIKPGEVFYDLGSGDGRLVMAAALRGAKAYGVEIDRFRVWYSRFYIFILGLSRRAKIIRRNIFEVDLSSADVVTTYLLQETNDALFEKLCRELKPGTRVVSAAFNFSKWEAITVDPNGPIYGPLYLYHVKSREENKEPRLLKEPRDGE